MTDDRPEVQTTAGTVRGVWRNESAAFLGIPFAEPPVGELRFAAPVPRRSWDGVLDAGEYGPTPQRATLQEVTLIPEPSLPGDSTLNVNVFTPAPGRTDAALPVLVYIHGGGFVAGSPASPWYDGAAFNRDGVVTVSVSYRLGFDGFGWIEDAPLNRGVLDWLLALEWVRDNIRQFGGDPARVTIAGQSAGGAAVLALLAVPRAAGLFHGAIAISGPIADLPLDEAERLGRAVADRLGVAPTRVGLSTVSEGDVLEVQNVVASPVPAEGDAAEGPLAGLAALASEGMKWGPVVDGDVLPTKVLEALSAGVSSDIPLVLGTTDNEFNMVPAMLGDALAGVSPSDVLGAIGVPSALGAEYVDSHPGLDSGGVLGQFITDNLFRRTTREIAEVRAQTDAPTWLYRFSWQSPTMHGAVHCLDVPFFFDCLSSERVDVIAGPNPTRSVAVDVHGDAVRFIASGDPGWPRYVAPSRDVRVFDEPSSVVPDGFGDVALLASAE